jgi:hypothetical protein
MLATSAGMTAELVAQPESALVAAHHVRRWFNSTGNRC